jgi:uncharacterized membrane protein YgcG
MTKHWAIALLVIGMIAFPGHGKAQTENDWVITQMESAISVQADGRVEVTETIQVDFGTREKHGIFRDLPEVYVHEDGSNRYTTLDVQEVATDGVPAPYRTERNDANMRIVIGDPDVLISGTHTYTIRYIASGILASFDTYDELYWNATGNEWGVPIEASRAEVTLPGSGIIQVSCYVGSYGSSDPCEDATSTDRTATFTHSKPLESYEGLTIAVGYRKSMVPIIFVAGPKSVIEIVQNSPTAGICFLLTLILGITLIIRIWRKKGRDIPIKGQGVVVVEYESPEHLRPAELGILRDESSKTLHISATIVDLAVRGYLEITEIPKEGILGKTDYTLTRKKAPDSALLFYERTLLDRLFGSTDTVTLGSLENSFYKDLAEIKKLVTTHALEKQFFTGDPTMARVKHGALAVLLGILGVIMTINGTIPTYTDLSRSMLLGIGPAAIMLGILYLITAIKGMPQRTAYGHELYRKAQGYEEFITNVETYRQRFFEKENMFMEVLPYAIIFGATTKLAHAMSVMGVVPQNPAWYHGATAFNVASFSSSVESFSGTLSSTMASAPSSSGSGGGGFSGGGGGGGGGGSW